jgi:hypothetical protein
LISKLGKLVRSKGDFGVTHMIPLSY